MCLNPYHEGDKPTVRHESLEAARLCLHTRRKIHVLELVGTMHPPVAPHGIWEDRRPS
jgi:hypothetical protein